MEKDEIMQHVNWEKIGVYIACLGFLFIFWQGQLNMSEKISEIKERIAKLEVKVDNIYGK
jgi:hypothetical protein